jgi:hypothetical protein
MYKFATSSHNDAIVHGIDLEYAHAEPLLASHIDASMQPPQPGCGRSGVNFPKHQTCQDTSVQESAPIHKSAVFPMISIVNCLPRRVRHRECREIPEGAAMSIQYGCQFPPNHAFEVHATLAQLRSAP